MTVIESINGRLERLENGFGALTKTVNEFITEVRSTAAAQAQICINASKQRDEMYRSLYGDKSLVSRVETLELKVGILWCLIGAALLGLGGLIGAGCYRIYMLHGG